MLCVASTHKATVVGRWAGGHFWLFSLLLVAELYHVHTLHVTYILYVYICNYIPILRAAGQPLCYSGDDLHHANLPDRSYPSIIRFKTLGKDSTVTPCGADISTKELRCAHSNGSTVVVLVDHPGFGDVISHPCSS